MPSNTLEILKVKQITFSHKEFRSRHRAGTENLFTNKIATDNYDAVHHIFFAISMKIGELRKAKFLKTWNKYFILAFVWVERTHFWRKYILTGVWKYFQTLFAEWIDHCLIAVIYGCKSCCWKLWKSLKARFRAPVCQVVPVKSLNNISKWNRERLKSFV